MGSEQSLIRRATLKDLSLVSAVHVQCWREAYRGILPDSTLEALDPVAREDGWRKVVTEEATALFVADDEDAGIIGLASCGAQRDKTLAAYPGEFGAIYVLKSHQKKRHGLKLMQAMCAELIGHGTVAASLWVLEDNAAARHFYDALGGEIISRKEIDVKGTAKTELAYGWQLDALKKLLGTRLS